MIGVAALAVMWCAVAWGQIDESRFASDIKALAQEPTRVVGTQGYYKAAEWIEKELAAIPGIEYRKHEYEIMVPATTSATLTMPGGAVEQVYPVWPATIRLNTTPAEGISGKLVYVGDCGIEQIKPSALYQNIAVIESSSGAQWTQAAYYGARAIIILGSPGLNNNDLRHHELVVPVSLPRCFIPDGPLADRLRKGQIDGTATLKMSARWERRVAYNFYALVRSGLLESVSKLPQTARWALGESANVSPPGWKASTAPAALMIAAPFDSSGLVPDLAPGASQAAQAAGALAMLRAMAKSPPSRPVVFYFGGADSIQFRATREMLMALSDVPMVWREELAELAKTRSDAEHDLERIKQIRNDPRSLDPGRDRLLIDRIVKLVETDAALDQDKLFRARIVRPEDQSPELKAFALEMEAQQVTLNRLKYAFQQRPDEISDEMLFSARKFIDRTIDRIEHLIARYDRRRDRLRDRISLYRWLATSMFRDADPDKRANNSRLIELMVGLDLSDQGVRVGPMFWGQWQRQTNISQIQDFRDWFNKQERSWSDGLKQGATPEDLAWWGQIKDAIDFEPLAGARTPQTWLAASMAIPTEMAQSWGVPAFTLLTLDDLRLRRDTPADTLSNLRIERITPQLQAVSTLLWNAWNDPKFKGSPEWKWATRTIDGQVVSTAAGRPVPDLPREGFLATYYYVSGAKTVPPLRGLPWSMGVRRSEIQDCDAEGKYQFEGLTRLDGDRARDLHQLAVQVYRLAEDGSITACSDLGKQSGNIKVYINTREDQAAPLRSLVFNCAEFSLVGLYDPRFLQDLGEVLPIDARRNAEPQRYNMLVQRQILAGFLEPGSSAYLLFRYGRVGNRLVLLNMPRDYRAMAEKARASGKEVAQGFRVGSDMRVMGAATQAATTQATAAAGPRQFTETKTPEGREEIAWGNRFDDMGPLAMVTATDFSRLDAIRLSDYQRAGVSSKLLDEMHASALKEMELAREAYLGNDGPGTMKHANGAWANEARVYFAAKDMANDVIRAAIFLLLLCIPFSFCMERLLIGTPNIYRQIGFLGAIFAVMAAALWSFHPAFKISSSPLIIILAFAIIFMSIVVIWVVYGKFDTELKRIRSGRGTAPATSFARASVLMSAVLLGIANMRKRKFRTALTSVTVVLITFAVLCFTSASRTLESTILPTGITTDKPGLVLRQRGFRPMPEKVLENLRAVLGPKQLIVERWWNINPGDQKDMIHVVSAPWATPDASASADASAAMPGRSDQPRARAILAAQTKPAAAPKVYAVQAMLGLTPGESLATPLKDVHGAAPGFDHFARLEKGDQRIVYLPDVMRERLNVKTGDWVKIGGVDLEVAGIYDSNDFDQKMTMLSGEPIAPLKYQSGGLDAGGRKLADSNAESLDLDAEGASAELGAAYEHLPSSQMVIVAAEFSKLMPNAQLRTVAIPLSRWEQVKPVSDELARRFAVAMFAGFQDGVKMVSAGQPYSVSGGAQVAIPLAIAGLIIFNTMMGSIAERRREIHVYTSLGLAPVHVGALFVAEALTYGLIGSVFGYVIGQGVGTAMLKLGWLGNVTLNYSGSSAMLTLSLILVIVLLSALVPARLASKIAAPSIERSWKVPLPKGDEIIAALPFTINQTAADGALAYLAEFFDAHQEGSIGKFSAGKVEAFSFSDDQGRVSRGLKTVIWLTPFDLGVRQHLMLLIHPGQFQDIYEVQVVLQRLSGDDGSWYRMNRTFLTELRKQFLQWRSLSPQRMLEYVEESRGLFGAAQSAPPPVVRTLPGEDLRLA